MNGMASADSASSSWRDRVVSCPRDGSLLVVAVRGGVSQLSDAVLLRGRARQIFESLRDGATAADVIHSIMESSKVSRVQAEDYTRRFLADLHSHDLLPPGLEADAVIGAGQAHTFPQPREAVGASAPELQGEDLEALARAVLSREIKLRFQARGHSMRPLIPDGSTLEITPRPITRVRRGEVALYSAGKFRLVAHRVISLKGGTLLARGDSSHRLDQITQENFLGIVTACATPRGKWVPVSSGWRMVLGLIGGTLHGRKLIPLRRGRWRRNRTRTRIRRGLWFLCHLGFSAVALLWFMLARRRGTLLFTHAGDIDQTGQDRQMGPLVDGLRSRGRRFVEVTLVPLSPGFLTNLFLKKRMFVSLAVILGPARFAATVFGMDLKTVRVFMATLVLRAVRPRIAYLTDESGSGQALLRAAKELGVRVVGIQHGDFQPTNRQYSLGNEPTKRVEPADLLCVWSPWFQERLIRISPIYSRANTRVVGRLRCSSAGRAVPAPAGIIRVLLVSEAHPSFFEEAAPFLEVLRRQRNMILRVRPHPAEPPGQWPPRDVGRGDLLTALHDADVVLGVGSSAILEGLFHRRPAVGLVTPSFRDPAGYGAEGLIDLCEDPEQLPGRCLSLAAPGAAVRVNSARELVWGGAPPDSLEAIIALEP